jgi:hypothetical protein
MLLQSEVSQERDAGRIDDITYEWRIRIYKLRNSEVEWRAIGKRGKDEKKWRFAKQAFIC